MFLERKYRNVFTSTRKLFAQSYRIKANREFYFLAIFGTLLFHKIVPIIPLSIAFSFWRPIYLTFFDLILLFNRPGGVWRA
jgi:hypothetical protein